MSDAEVGQSAGTGDSGGRRAFLDTILGTGFVTTLVAMAYPVWRFLIPPESGEPAVASVVAATLAEMPPNSGRLVRFGNRPGLLIRTAEGEFRAFSGICSHLDCTVQYQADTSQIWCACHNGFYDEAGNVVSGPPPRRLEQFIVNVRGDVGKEEVVVSRA